MVTAQEWLQRIRSLPLSRRVKILNVCGGHERAISMAGLRAALPDRIELIPGPGCPVCVCPEEAVYDAIQLAMRERVILVAFGDMLRVPVNAPKRDIGSLDEARAAGAAVRPVASPRDAVQIAEQNPDVPVVFFVAGFETTTAPAAAMLLEGVPDNLSVLLAGRLTWPAVAMLLESDSPGFDGLIAPGHVATIMGAEQWRFVAEDHCVPTAVAGFTSESLLAAIYSVLRQLIEGRCFLDNCYPAVARAEGNSAARRQLETMFDVVDATWRGIGTIPQSGFKLREEFSNLDAAVRFPQAQDQTRKRIGEMPPGCECARVVLGKIYPDRCPLYGRACTPRTPIGPCMVSDEGACRIWWAAGKRPVAELAVAT